MDALEDKQRLDAKRRAAVAGKASSAALGASAASAAGGKNASEFGVGFFVENVFGSGAVLPAIGELPPLPPLDVTALWDSLWYADGKDVTQTVIELMRHERRFNISYIQLPNNFNSAFGDPSFGNEKVLVIEYVDSTANNLTAVWREKVYVCMYVCMCTHTHTLTHTHSRTHTHSLSLSLTHTQGSRPRVWKNQDRTIVAAAIASSADASADAPAAPAEGTASPSGGGEEGVEGEGSTGTGNLWLRDLVRLQALENAQNGQDADALLRDVDLFTEDLYSQVSAGPEASLTLEEEDENPPPPVIPFIKYASPGPPKSPWLSPDCTQPAFRILSLDGGGVRGVLTAVILGRIVKEVPSFLDNVDLIAGTSTGGLMGLMLAAGYTPQECEDIYKYACPLIFAKDPWRVYNPLKAKYNPQGRSEMCRAYLNEDRTLRDLKKHVVITSFKLDGKVGQMGAFISMNGGWRPAVFSNIPRLDGKLEPDLDLLAWDAAMRTSAAPTYFPSHKGYVDGAMFANNPSMLAVSKACAHFPKVTPENTVVLSVGVGNFPISIETPETEDLDWGIKDWVPYIFDLLLDGDSLSTEVLLRYLLNAPSKNQNNADNRYHRIDATLPRYMELDDVTALPLLVEIGNNLDLNDTIAFVQKHFSSTPTASDAFAQAAVKTASWARETALKVQLNEAGILKSPFRKFAASVLVHRVFSRVDF